jgi:uncharacterized protein (TIGR02594 family)
VDAAKKYEGIREIKGPKTHPTIEKWLIELGAWYKDDETPWCGTFCAAVMRDCSFSYPKVYMRALDWAKWGYDCKRPILGCIAVKERKGGGHVTIVTGVDSMGNLLCIGGNQGDKVCIVKYGEKDFQAFRYPILPPSYKALPLILAEYEKGFKEA